MTWPDALVVNAGMILGTFLLITFAAATASNSKKKKQIKALEQRLRARTVEQQHQPGSVRFLDTSAREPYDQEQDK